MNWLGFPPVSLGTTAVITRFQIGAAPLRPVVLRIGV
jgi:hypothetical protein